MKSVLTARSPAKLILSGEHAVLYGKPALAMAIDRYTESTITSNLSSLIFFNLLNLQYAGSVTRYTLLALKQRLQDKYHAFLEGRLAIRDVLKKPFELLQYTVSNLLEKWNVFPPHGLEISASSNIPIGCGMGSSAALVMSTLYALAHFFKLDIDLNRFLSLGREAENLQHGFSSGLDLQLALSGGMVRFQEGLAEKRVVSDLPMSIVQTGMPLVSTGECVTAVAPHFKQSSIGDDFESVTNHIDLALQTNHLSNIQEGIRQNHRLLSKIGVVPQKVQSFIDAIERQGGAAKICGAGSITGDNAGVMLVIAERDFSPLIMQYGYQSETIQRDIHGTHVV